MIQQFLDAFTVFRVLAEVLSGLLFGYYAFGRPVTMYTRGVVDVSGYVSTTAVTCLILGGLFFIPAFFASEIALGAILAGAVLWVILCLSIAGGIALKLRNVKRASSTLTPT